MKKTALLFFMAFLFFIRAKAQTFDFNQRCTDAYDLILQMRFSESETLLAQEKKSNPQNLIPYFIENYIDFLKTYIDEDKNEFESLEPNKDIRLDKLKDGDKSSPYYLYSQAEILIQWSFSRLKYGEYVTAFSEVKKAYTMLEENEKKFPDFIADKKSLGMLHCIVGAIPDNYKWGANMLGMDGTIEQGLGELQSLIDYAKTHDVIFAQESRLYYAFLALYLNKDETTAWNIVKDLDVKTNLLNCFCVASIAMHTGKNDLAITVLQNRPMASNYYNYAYFDFMYGLAKSRRLDNDAPDYLTKFISEFKGINYIKEAYQKLAWNALIQGDQQQYSAYMNLVKTKGDDIIDDDKQAEYEAENEKIPDVTLLKSRLLFDGGYYKESLKLLEGKSINDFADQRDKTEFTYRAGRIYDAAGFPDQAKGFYLTTIQNGSTLHNYFAASAAVHLGMIYEKSGDYDKAKYYYDKALDLPDDEYKTSIEGDARAGLNRIRDK